MEQAAQPGGQVSSTRACPGGPRVGDTLQRCHSFLIEVYARDKGLWPGATRRRVNTDWDMRSRLACAALLGVQAPTLVYLADSADPGMACGAKRQLLKLLDVSAPTPEGAPLVLRGRTLAHRLAVAEAVAAAGGPSEPEALVLLEEQPVLEVLSERAPGMGLDQKLDLLGSQPEVRTRLGHLNLGY